MNNFPLRSLVEGLESRTFLSAAPITFVPSQYPPPFTIGVGHSKSVDYNGFAGDLTRITLNGPGTATVSYDQNSDFPGSVSIAVTGTTSASTLTIHGQRNVVPGSPGFPSNDPGVVYIGNITGTGSFRTIHGPITELTGSIDLTGSVGTLTLDSADGVSTSPVTVSAVSIGNLFIGDLADANVTAATIGITRTDNLTGTWTITGSAGSIYAQSIDGLGASFGSLAKLSVQGSVSDSTIRTSGDSISLQVQGMDDANFYAGISSSVSSGVIPTSADVTETSTIRETKIGKLGFTGSVLAAADFGNLALGPITLDNAGTPFGIAAQQITALTATAGGKKLALKDVTMQSQVITALANAGIAPGDFNVNVI